VWTSTPVGGILPRLHLGDGQESSLTPARFVELLTDHLRTAPPGWDPYTPTSCHLWRGSAGPSRPATPTRPACDRTLAA
jgi:hypothetical protein